MSDNNFTVVKDLENIPFTSEYTKSESAGFSPWTLKFKRDALELYKEKFTHKLLSEKLLKFILENKFEVFSLKLVPSLDVLLNYPSFGVEAYTLVIVNGLYIPEVSDEDAIPFSVYSDGMNNCLIDDADFLKNKLSSSNELFYALNSAYLKDGIVVKIADGEKLDKPLHIISITISDDGVLAINPRIYIEVGKGAELNIIESNLSLDKDKYFENKVIEFHLSENSKVNHYRYFDISSRGVVVENVLVDCDISASYVAYGYWAGGGIFKGEAHLKLANYTVVGVHNAFNAVAKADISYKVSISQMGSFSSSLVDLSSVVSDEAKVLFDTSLDVKKGLERVNALQYSKILLGSSKAVGVIKPYQTISSEEVKAFHGAVVGGISDSDLFFLESRGITKSEAEHIIKISALFSNFSKIQDEEILQEYYKNICSC